MADIFGITVQDAPEGWTVLEVVTMVKALNEDGEVAHFTRFSDGLGSIEVIGMLRVAEQTQLDIVKDSFDPD